MSDTFKVGDVVYLKSGGPAMTVVDKREGYILCMWHIDGEGMKTVDFVPESLTHVDKKIIIDDRRGNES